MATIYTQRSHSESDRSKKAREELDKHQSAKPGSYESAWMPELDSAVDQILNREAFQYDLNTDPLYNQYRNNYVNQGQMAMLDTLGQASTLTGGYGNSYAQQASQQAYQSQLQNLNNVIPELYQLALDTYDRQGQALMNRYAALYDREALDYGRYQDGLGLWANERDYLAGRYDTERGFDYTEYRDLVGDDQWKAAFDEDIRRYDYAHHLGEFAPTGGGSGAVSSGGTSPKDKEKEENGGAEKSMPTKKASPPSWVLPYLYTYEKY